MTELKCPICQNNLHKINIVVSTCINDKCKLWGASIPNLVLEALTDTKKKLDIAVERLTQISQESFQGDTQSINLGFHVLAAAALTDIEQINKKEEK